MAEIAYITEAGDRRDDRRDWETARIVAMVAATASKKEKYRPAKWMANGKARQAEARRPGEPMTGDQIMQRFQQLGVRIIDQRARAE